MTDAAVAAGTDLSSCSPGQFAFDVDVSRCSPGAVVAQRFARLAETMDLAITWLDADSEAGLT